jgi:hypothetical protein
MNRQSKFRKVMSIPDSLIYNYFLLATEIDESRLMSVKAKLEDKIV